MPAAVLLGVGALAGGLGLAWSLNLPFFVVAVAIQQETGSNLAEVLQTTAETMVQRNRLRREMKALTAEGRISAIGLPVSITPPGVK